MVLKKKSFTKTDYDQMELKKKRKRPRIQIINRDTDDRISFPLTYYDDCQRTIGKGSFAVVCIMIDKRTKEARAVKVMTKTEKNGKNINSERILQKLKHPNIVKLIEDFGNQATHYFVLELCKGSDLFNRICALGAYTETSMKILFKQLLEAVVYLHTRPTPIAHLDIKPENIMVDDKRHTIKLVDFGFATECNDLLTESVGTVLYCAPEILDNRVEKEYDGKQVDAWSCAVVAFVMLVGYPPFLTRQQILQNNYSIDDPAFSSISGNTKNYLKNTFVIDPDSRLSVVEANEWSW